MKPGLQPQRRPRHLGSASKRDAGWDFGGRLVDEGKIVLRKRIHEMEMAERNYEPPADWMEWEKRYYVRYGSDVCELMGLIQALLMKTRPSMAMGMVAMVMLSLPASAVAIVLHVMEVARTLLPGGAS